MATKKTQPEKNTTQPTMKRMAEITKDICGEVIEIGESHSRLCDGVEGLSEKHNNLVDYAWAVRNLSYIALGASVINTILIIVLFINK